jgi:hypothetical protein
MLALVIVYCLWVESWEGVLFISGVLLAQLTLVREARGQNSALLDHESDIFLATEKDIVNVKKRPALIGLALFPFALYLASAPLNGEVGPLKALDD